MNKRKQNPVQEEIISIGKFRRPHNVEYLRLKKQLTTRCIVLLNKLSVPKHLSVQHISDTPKRTDGSIVGEKKDKASNTSYNFESDDGQEPTSSNMSMPLLDDEPDDFLIYKICHTECRIAALLSPLHDNKINDTNHFDYLFSCDDFDDETWPDGSTFLPIDINNNSTSNENNIILPIKYLMHQKYRKFEKYLRKHSLLSDEVILEIFNTFSTMSPDDVLNCLRVVMERRRCSELTSLFASGFLKILIDKEEHSFMYYLISLCEEHQVDIISETVDLFKPHITKESLVIQTADTLAKNGRLKCAITFLLEKQSLLSFGDEDAPILQVMENFELMIDQISSQQIRRESILLLKKVTELAL